jgi:hypothetical protein
LRRHRLRRTQLGIPAAITSGDVLLAPSKTHIGALLGKLSARDRVQLVITAYRAGLVDSDVR